MSFNGSGVFSANSSGLPVVTATVISSTVFNAMTADIATGLSTCITKDGQTTATVRIPFAQGITSTLATDSSSISTGSIITAGGVGVAKSLVVGTKSAIGGALDANAMLKLTGAAQASARLVIANSTWAGAVLLIDQDNSGNATINLQANAALNIATNNATVVVISAAGALQLAAYGAGTLVSDASGHVTSSSDERMKYVLGPFLAGIDALRKINPIFYRWREDSGMDPEGMYAGFSAQNVQQAEAYGVGRNRNDDMLSLQDRALLAVCVNAIKTLDNRLFQLEKTL